MNKIGRNSLVLVTVVGLTVAMAACGGAKSNPNNASGNTSGASSSSGAASGTTTNTAAKNVTINETGSSLLYPLFSGQWIDAYKSQDPSVTLTAASTGSGHGIQSALDGTAQIGASDAYLPDSQMKANPGMLNIPLAISAQQIMYNLPGIKDHVKLTGDVLAQIFSGKITKWNDPAIAKLNPGVNLPAQTIIPVRRTDGSGDTFLFTQFLSDTNADWKNGPAFGTDVSWPSVGTEIGEKGNEGVVTGLVKNKYSIGYVGISFLDKGTSQGLGYAALQNQAGKFVLPTSDNIQAAVNAQVNNVPADERISLIYGPGDNSYPIINFEYGIINTKQSSDMVAPLKKFLTWAIDPKGGNQSKYLDPVHFIALPSSVEPKSQAQIDKIGG